MKPYPKYKASRVEWIGQVPERWELKRMKYTSFINPIKDDSIDKESADLVTFLPMENVSEAGQICCDAKRTISSLWTGFTYFRKNDVIIAKITPCFENGKGALLNELDTEFGFGSTEFHVLRALGNVLPVFLFYITRTYQFRVLGEAFMTGAAGQKRVPTDFLENFVVGLPSVPEEQTAIATYLDRKTAEIDRLIANKERLIELYEEEKTTIINQAVTKGLNPDVPMKPSGIDWLGDIPEHWIPTKLKYIVEVKDGTHATPDYIMPSEDSFPLVTSKDLQQGFVDFTECKHISPNDYEDINRRSNVVENDIIMPMIGTVGGAVVVETKRSFSIKNVALFKTSESEVKPFFLKYLIDSVLVKNQFSLQSRGGVQDFVSLTILKNIRMFNFPGEEQTAIVQHIENECSRLDTIIDKFKKQIELLKEYRTTLISEVVTGKIDVRDEVVQ